MKTLVILSSYLPLLSVIIGCIALFAFIRKSHNSGLLKTLAVVIVVYYFFDAQIVNPSPNYDLLAFSIVLIPFLASLTKALMINLMWKIFNEEERLPWYQYLWHVAPISILSMGVTLYFIAGPDEFAQYLRDADLSRSFPEPAHDPIYFVGMVLLSGFYLLFFVYTFSTIAIAYHYMRMSGFTLFAFRSFLFKKSTLPPLHITMLSIMFLLLTVSVGVLMTRDLLFAHPVLSISLAVLQSVFVLQTILSTLSLDYPECTLRQIYGLDPKEELEEVDVCDSNQDNEEEDCDEPEESILKPAVTQMFERFEKDLETLVLEPKLFLNPDLKITDVAQILCTNRNYLSTFFNQYYHVSYSDYINQKRIDYAKEYMLSNRSYTLDHIAVECGFSAAQSFSRLFKAKVGVSPRRWLVMELTSRR